MAEVVTTQFPSRAVAVEPSDATYFVPSTIYCGSAGNVVVEPEVGGNTLTFVMLAGGIVPVKVVRVLAATTAANLVRIS